jgi:four helix bundle protein
MEIEDKGLETLQVWRRYVVFAGRVCRDILPTFPPDEKWSMASQLRRAVQSIPANIAEGYGRYYYQDAVRFCYIARGSMEETFSHIFLACNLGYISQDTFESLNREIQELRRMLSGYINFLKNSKRGLGEPGSGLSMKEDASLYYTDSDDLGINS